MSLVVAPASQSVGSPASGNAWSLAQVGFGMNEIASAIMIGKSTGTLVSRQSDAVIFKLLAEQCQVRFIRIPRWLENFGLARRTQILGFQMRSLAGGMAMEDVPITSIEGVCSVIVLCTRYSESLDSVLMMVEAVLTGRVQNTTIDPGQLKEAQESAWRSWRPSLKSWVQAVQSSDADSPQARKAKKYLAELAQEGVSIKLSSNFYRCYQTALDFISDLFGQEKAESKKGHWEEKISRTGPFKQRVFNTMLASVASIGLAAAANDGSISVECVIMKGGTQRSTILPRDLEAPTLFLIRLWLCQPPSEIHKTLGIKRNDRPVPDELLGNIQAYGNSILFGGEREIALACARELDFWDERQTDMEERVLCLWKAGQDLGQSLRWRVCSPESYSVQRSTQSYFILSRLPDVQIAGLHVLALANTLISRAKYLKPIARIVAKIVDEEYGISEYVNCTDSNLFQKAMDFVVTAISTGCLKRLTLRPENLLTYAINLGALTIRGSGASQTRTGEFWSLIKQALPAASGTGVTHAQILWCGALLWGGASYASQGYRMVDDNVIGVVAPHCTIILDYLRDPERFAQNGFREDTKLVSIHVGAVPVLARDPVSGFVLGATGDSSGNMHIRELDCHAEGSRYLDSDDRFPSGDLLLTFEPSISETTSGSNQFLAWYQGDLAFELDPRKVFANLLLRRCDTEIPEEHDSSCISSGLTNERRAQEHKVRYLDFTEVMDHQEYYVENGVAVFNVNKNPAWAVACAGCAALGTVVVQRGQIQLGMADITDTIIWLGDCDS